jgi:hypothetical protein
MRPATAGPAGRSVNLLLASAIALLAVACDDSSSVQEPAVTDGGVAATKAPVTRDPGHWTDGYVSAAAWGIPPAWSFNRTGGAVTSTSPGPGRVAVTFSGLSALLGRTSTLHVTGATGSPGGAGTFCTPVEAYLVRDDVEVRCYGLGTGAPTSTFRNVMINRNYSDLAYAYADRPTSTNYSPQDRGSWNPAGATTVFRTGVGQYQVVFYELQRIVWDANNNGVWQVNAVGSDNVYCKLASAGGSTAMFANVRCYTPAGAPADSKFTVHFALPNGHIAYVHVNQPSTPFGSEYAPYPYDSWNPVGSWISVNRTDTGDDTVTWNAVRSGIVGPGLPQVTAEGPDNALCNPYASGFDQQSDSWKVRVVCYSPSNERVDSRFRVLIGS